MTKIRVRLGAAEAEVEADDGHLQEAIELIPELIKRLPGTAAAARDADTSDALSPSPEAIKSPPHVDLPGVNFGKNDSLADIIGKLFSDPWGRDRRKLSDVREALQSYGLNYPKQSVAVALLRLAKTGRIRRFKGDDGEFVYTSSTSIMNRPQPTPSEPTLDAAS